MAERLEEHDARPFAKREGTRRQVFEEQEGPPLRPPPAVPHEACEWACGRRAQRSCRVAYGRNHYSVSHPTVGRTVDLRVTDSTAEVLLGGERLATHPPFPAYARNRYSTHAGDPPGGEVVPRLGRRAHKEAGGPRRPVPRGGGGPHLPARGPRGAGPQRGPRGARARAPPRQAQARARPPDGAGLGRAVSQAQAP